MHERRSALMTVAPEAAATSPFLTRIPHLVITSEPQTTEPHEVGYNQISSRKNVVSITLPTHNT